MNREFLQSLVVGDSALPEDIIDAILAEHGKGVATHQQAAQQWEDKYNQAVTKHSQELAQLTFDGIVKDAVTASRGKNLKAIKALLDITALQESSDPTGAVQEAVAQLQKEHGYLFDSAPAQPPYAKGAGTAGAGENTPDTLAGALRERFRGDL